MNVLEVVERVVMSHALGIEWVVSGHPSRHGNGTRTLY